MINPDVLAYIRGQIALGISRDAITKALSTGGWSEQDVTEAFAAIDGVVVAPPPPPVKPVQPSTQQTPPAFAVPLQTAQNAPQSGTAVPAQRPGAYSTAGQPATLTPSVTLQGRSVPGSPLAGAPSSVQKRRGAGPMIFLFLFILILAGIAAVYILYPSLLEDYLPASQMTTREPVLNETVPYGEEEGRVLPQQESPMFENSTTSEDTL